MIEAISSYQGSGEDLYEIRKALLEAFSKKELSSKKIEEPKGELSKKQVEEEKRLSPKTEETEVLAEEEMQEEVEATEEQKIVVSATELEVLDIEPVVSDANIETDEEYNPDMDFDGDGIITDEERIKYYSQKYEAFDAEETLEGENTSSGASNPISNNISLINKMQMSYGQYSQEVQSNLAILV